MTSKLNSPFEREGFAMDFFRELKVKGSFETLSYQSMMNSIVPIQDRQEVYTQPIIRKDWEEPRCPEFDD